MQTTIVDGSVGQALRPLTDYRLIDSEQSGKNIDKVVQKIYNYGMKKDIVYSIRMASLVRDTLKRAATKERRTVASLLDKIILNYLEEQLYLLPHEIGDDRRAHQRSKITLPAMTIMENGIKNYSFPCVITDIAMGGVNITYPKGSKVKEVLLRGQDDFRLLFKLPENGAEIDFHCDARRLVDEDREIHVGAKINDPNPNDLSKLKTYLS